MWTERLIGVLLFWLVLTLLLAAVSHLVPDRAGQYISVQLRMLDSLRPHLLVLSVFFAAALLALGQARLAGLGVGAALLILCALVIDHARRVAPQAETGDLTLVWFNMLETNAIAPERLAQALAETDADVIVLGESRPAADLPTLMRQTHPHRAGCDAAGTCGLMVLSRVPLGPTRIRDFRSGPQRFARIVIDLAGHVPVHLIAVHMVKPWFTAMAAPEREALEAALTADPIPPTILLGDFNAAPWSRRIRRLEKKFGLRHAPRPLATWPTSAGRLGVPIDHVLLRGGTAFAEITTWGADLGSNHRGLRAAIALPPGNDTSRQAQPER